MRKEIYFDLDGTLAAFYNVPHWLDYLNKEDTYPYEVAAPMWDFVQLAQLLNTLQAMGWKLGIVSWTSKNGSELFNLAVEHAKRHWLAVNLPTVEWDEIHVVRYGTNKRKTCGGGILFDDEEGNRKTWGKHAYTPDHIMEILKALARD